MQNGREIYQNYRKADEKLRERQRHYMFDYVVLDLINIKSIMDAAKNFPHVDRLCLNAGRLALRPFYL